MSEDMNVGTADDIHQLKAGYQFLATRSEDLFSSVSGFESGLVKCNQETEARVQDVEQRVAAFETWLSVAGIKDMEERLVEHGKRMASWEEEILRQLAGTKSAFKDLLSSISGVENGLESVSRDFNERLRAMQQDNSAGTHLSQIRDLETRLATFECRLDLMSRSQGAEALDSQLTSASQDWKPQVEDLEARLASFDSKLERLLAGQRVDAPPSTWQAQLASFESRLDKFQSQKPEQKSALSTQKPTEVERELGNAAYRGAIETELRSAKSTMQMQLTQHKLEFTTSLQDARQSMEELAARFFSHAKSPAEEISKLESRLEESHKTLESRLDESCDTFEVRLSTHVLEMDSRLTAYQNQLDKFVEARLGTHIQESVRHVEDVDRSIKSFHKQLESACVEDMDERIKTLRRQLDAPHVADCERLQTDNMRQQVLSGPERMGGHSVELPIYRTDSPRQTPTPVIIPGLASPAPSYVPVEMVQTPTASCMISAARSSPMISGGTSRLVSAARSSPMISGGTSRLVSAGRSSPMISGGGTPAPPPGIASPRAAHPLGRAPSPGTMYVTQRVAAVPAPLIGAIYAPSAIPGS